jgi:transcription elongation factor GreB
VSKAFTKDEGEGSDEPVVVPPRASLPDGTINYVTAQGMAALHAEMAALEAQRSGLASAAGDEASRRRARVIADARIAALTERIATASVIDPREQPRDEVRFGATVTVRDDDGRERTMRIVGVDEADVGRGAIAFVAPLARAMLGKRVGEAVVVRTPRGEEELEVVAIAYDG